MRVMPGDQASEEAGQQVRRQMGLDKPLPEQFLGWLSRLAQGDLATSYTQRRPVSELVGKAFGHTLALACRAFALSVVLGLAIGIPVAASHGTLIDHTLMTIAVEGISVPSFFAAIVPQLVFSLRLGLLPLSGVTAPGSFVLPAIALGTRQAASIARVTRSSLLETLGNDYMHTAIVKGLTRRMALVTHDLRNALIPIITICGTLLGGIFAGAIIVESVFGIPSIGTLPVTAIGQRDLPLVEGDVTYVTLVCALAYLLTTSSTPSQTLACAWEKRRPHERCTAQAFPHATQPHWHDMTNVSKKPRRSRLPVCHRTARHGRARGSRTGAVRSVCSESHRTPCAAMHRARSRDRRTRLRPALALHLWLQGVAIGGSVISVHRACRWICARS